jgi:hypothetical protein
VPPSAAPVPIDPKVDPAEFYCRMMREIAMINESLVDFSWDTYHID